MCQYSSEDGYASDWHLVHLGAFAVGGAGLVMAEGTAVTPEGRISPHDLGLWKDGHIERLSRIARFVAVQGAVPGIQLAHAGRKGSTARPWEGAGEVPPGAGGWRVIAPSAIPFAPNYPLPLAMTRADIDGVIEAFRLAALRAIAAGFRVIEIHAAHGYLLHEFLSPLSNARDDEFGGSFDNRARFTLSVVDAVRNACPAAMPLLVRISATDWAAGGWDPDQSVELARLLAARGVDMVDCSSGGLVSGVTIPLGPGYNVPFARRIRQEAAIATGVVGLITGAAQVEEIVASGDADVVFMARELLRQPRWPLVAAQELGADVTWPSQYLRAKPPRVPPS